MKFNQREVIRFSCTCRIEEIDIAKSEKTGNEYAKIVSVEGNRFLCFRDFLFRPLIDFLSQTPTTIQLEGVCVQKRGGTYLSVEKAFCRDLAGQWVKIGLDQNPDDVADELPF